MEYTENNSSSFSDFSWYQSIGWKPIKKNLWEREKNATMGDDGKKPPFVIDIQSPYYLHPSYSPGVTITAIKFDGRNYELWEQALQTALIAKNKLSLIDGTIT